MFFVPRCHPPSESPEDTPHSPFGAAPPQKGGAAHHKCELKQKMPKKYALKEN